MRLISTTILLFFLLSTAYSQTLTGIWRGYFVSNTSFHVRTGQFVEDKYKFEVHINNLANNQIEGVTYSYKTTVFYGKAAMQGIYTKANKVLLFKETKMIEEKHNDNTFVCPMTCYLDYKKSADKKETLTGTYTSVNLNDGSECGSGTVYLEKVTTTEFEKEDFLIKKKPNLLHLKDKNTPSKQSQQSSLFPAKKLNMMKPGAEDFVITHKDSTLNKSKPSIDTVTTFKTDSNTITKDTAAIIPDVLTKRENVLAHTLIVDSQDVTIEFYDNGQIDGDTISVYHDSRAIIRNKRLGYTPITMTVHIPEQNPVYEFIEVAENLGSVPPNTALVIVSSGSKHYEINIASDEQRNAKIILQYQKPPEKK